MDLETAQKEVLESYRREFDQLTSTFRDLDGKAQGTAAIAGVFLAACVGFSGKLEDFNFSLFRGVLAIAVVSLVAVVAFSLRTLAIRDVTSAPSGESVQNILTQLRGIESDADFETRLGFLYGDITSLWKACVRDRREANAAKASHVWSAQRSLVASALLVAILILAVIFR